MDIEFIEKLIEMMARSPIDELELERDGWRVRLAKTSHVANTRPASTALSHPMPFESGSPEPGDPARQPSGHVIRATLTGTFYRSATEGGPPLVAEGDRVGDGQVLGILEAMKMLNPIEADRAGRIVRILVENAQPVQSGDPLFAFEPE